VQLTEKLAKKNDVGKEPIPFAATMVNVFLLVLKLVYISVSKRALEFYSCTYNADLGEFLYNPAPSRRCYNDQWYGMLPYSIAGIVIYVCGIPLLFYQLFRLRQRFLLIKRDERTFWQQFLLQCMYKRSSEFRYDTEYWDVTLLLRKFAIVGCQILLTKYVAMQAMALAMVLLLFALAHTHVRPFSLKSLNFLEGMTLMSSIIVLCGGVMYYVNELQRSTDQAILTYSILVTISLSSILVVALLMVHLRDLYGKFKLRRAKDKKKKEKAEKNKHRKHKHRRSKHHSHNRKRTESDLSSNAV
jgi:hypothetical protein